MDSIFNYYQHYCQLLRSESLLCGLVIYGLYGILHSPYLPGILLSRKTGKKLQILVTFPQIFKKIGIFAQIFGKWRFLT